MKLKANMLLLLAAFLWGVSYIATEFTLQANIGALELTFWRFFIALIFVYAFNYKAINKYFLGHLRYSIPCGVLMFLGYTFQILGQKYGTPSSASFLTSTQVVYIAVITCIFTRQKISKQSLLSVIIVTTGVALLTIKSDFSIAKGDVFALICSLFFGLHTFSCWYSMQKDYTNNATFSFIQFLVCSILGLITCLFTGFGDYNLTFISVSSLLYLGIVASFLCYYLKNIAVKYLSASNASIVNSLEAVFATLLSVLIFKESFSLVQFLGICLIFSAIVISQLNLKKKKG